MTAARATAGAPARPFPTLALGEVAFALVSLATVIGLRRVFVGGDWLAPLVVHVVAAHGTITLLRHRRTPTLPAVLVTVVAALVAISWVHAGDATAYGIPTPGTLDALVTAVGDAFAQFSDIKAPTEPLEGFMIATAATVWAGAVVGDWAAFRADATVEAVLPAAALFGVASVLGADTDRIAVTGVWVAAVLAFALLRRADRLGRSSTWVGDHRDAGPRTLVVLGVGLALVATVVAAVVGPQLPGAEAEAVVSLTDLGDDEPSTRVTVSPLVEIRSRLVDQADVEVFTVRSEQEAYWRLTSLEAFDGEIWKSNGSYGKAEGDLDDGIPVESERVVFDQQYTVRALSSLWLPAAYEPQAVQVEQPVRYDEVSGTLIVDTDVPSSDGNAYAVRSALPVHAPEALASASTEIPGDIAERYLSLPDDFSPDIVAQAQAITAGSANRYDAAMRLQEHFRTNFTYDLEVALGHGVSDMHSFLFEVRSGYCEQFAGSYAAMARALDIPARVAVGFTPGVADPDDPTLFRVRGEHAHAWPELYFGEHGWVPFEPTPGRGSPLAEAHTGVPAQQVQSGGNPNTATTSPAPPTTQATAPSTPDLDRPLPTFPDEPSAELDGDTDDSGGSPWPRRIAIAAVLLVAGAGLYLLGVLVVGWAIRRYRRRQAATNEARVALAWEESLDAARRAGAGVRPSATQAQAAEEIARRFPTVEEPIRALAGTVETLAYAPTSPDEEAGARALTLADEVGSGTRATMSPGERFRTRFDPRQLRRP